VIPLAAVAQVRAAEEAAMAAAPDVDLMAQAAHGLAMVIERVLAGQGVKPGKAQVVALIGSGNNGGDALFAVAEIAAAGASVVAITTGSTWHEAGMSALLAAGGAHQIAADLTDDALMAFSQSCDVLVDGIVGIGGSGGLREQAVRVVSLTCAPDPFTVSVDVPSGVDADSGVVTGAAVRADVTVTFGVRKPGLLIAPGKDFAGEIELIDIGLSPFLMDEKSQIAVLEGIDVATYVPEPDSMGHKYTRGVVGVATGSPAYPGAAALSVGAARWGGVGMVHYLDRGDGLAALVIEHYPDVIASGADPRELPRVTGWVCGCGFDRAVDADAVRAVLTSDQPVVLDASALGIVASDDSLRDRIAARDVAGFTTIITPHEGEFATLFPGLIAQGRLAAARSAAHALGAIVVLKGPGTIIAAPDGSVRIDTEGTAVLSCAGSGDVLAGIIGSVVAATHARGRGDLVNATAAAVWLHGRAGRIAGSRGRPVTALEILDNLPEAISHARRGEGA
jgi:ADP-dependent NAD(P)H-hydrate dehydratase / NAD(P)H-hydrate epimerase